MLNFNQLAFLMRAEAEHYKANFIATEKKRDETKTEISKTYIKQTPTYLTKMSEADDKCASEIAEMRSSALNNVVEHVATLKEHEATKLKKISEETLSKLKMLDGIPLTASELSAIADKYDVANDYYSARYLQTLAEKNGLEFVAGIEPSYDTKMAILSDLETQFVEVLTDFNTSKGCDPKVKYANLSEDVIQRACELYGGSSPATNPEQVASKALLSIKSAHGSIEQGITISNVLKNASEDTRNLILCGVAENENIPEKAVSYSGFADEINDFKNGGAVEYRRAQKCIENMKAAKDIESATYYMNEIGENRFIGAMARKAAKSSVVIADCLSKQAELIASDGDNNLE